MASATNFRAWYLVHKWTSLVCTLFLLMLCITGLPLIFAHEIDHALGYAVDPPKLDEAPAVDADIDLVVADAAARRPMEAVQFLVADPGEPELLYVRLGQSLDSAEASAFYTYDARTGDFLADYPVGQGFMDIMLRLHVDMYAGLAGMLFLGFMGLLLAASLVSGVVLYGPHMRKLKFGMVRRGRQIRLKWLDLHNLLGIVTLVWLMVVGVTGVINTLSVPIFDYWQATELAELQQQVDAHTPLDGPVSASAAVAAARAAEPELGLSFMAFPGNDFATARHYMAFMQGLTPLSAQVLTLVMIDAESAEVVATRTMPWYVTTLMMSQPLHFGDYGGLGLKVVWALLDLVAIYVLISGLVLWWRRRKAGPELRADATGRSSASAEMPA